MIIVFTGNGKGKTTAALGQAIRVLGQDKRVLMIQFIKSGQISGENKFLKKFKIPQSKLQIIPAGKGFVKILGDKLPFFVHKRAAQNGLELFKKALKSGKRDLIILDEINVAVNLKLIKAAEVLKILKSAPKNIDIILTGRNAAEKFIKYGDLVTEMREMKHPFQKGQSARIGIEF
jgi:cob(I)alamin adenosyltransferase